MIESFEDLLFLNRNIIILYVILYFDRSILKIYSHVDHEDGAAVWGSQQPHLHD